MFKLLKAEPTHLEIVAVLLIACAIMAYSFTITYDADLSTLSDPSARRFVRHAYEVLGFQFIGLMILSAMLLPRRIREDYLYQIESPSRLVLYFLIPWLLFALFAINLDVYHALHAGARPVR